MHICKLHPKINEDQQKLCPVCEKPADNEYQLQIHIKYEHFTKEPIICTICQKKFRTPHGLRIHKRDIHEVIPQNKTFPCDTCGEVFLKYRHMNNHRIVEHGSGHTCNYCGKNFKRKGAFKQHINLHESEKGGYICDICGKEHDHITHLREHKRRHLEPVIPGGFKCEIPECLKAFDKLTSLRNHYKNVHTQRVKRIPCGYCSKMFYRNRDKIEHENSLHLNNKEYKCDHCDFETARRTYLTSHIKGVHSGQMFYCDFPGCDKSYNLKRNLVAHKQRVHKEGKTDEKDDEEDENDDTVTVKSEKM